MSKIAIVISHPIQHFCPQYASFAKIPNVNIKVFFASTVGLKPYKDDKFKQEISWGRLYLDEFNHEFVNGSIDLPINANLDSDKLEEKLEEFGPDGIITYGYYQKLQRRAYNWALKKKKKIFYISDSELSGKRLAGLTFIKKFYLDQYFRKVNAFLTVGDSNEYYYKYYGVPFYKMSRTFFPIDIKTYEEALSNKDELINALLVRHNISKDDFIISTVGKLISIKRQLDVIKALLTLDNFKERRIVYFLIGNGPDKEMLEDIASKVKFHKIIFTGFTKPEDLPSYYLASDLYIHPSEIEPHSLAISEAIYSSCPIVLSDKCGSYGPTDDVKAGFNGFAYESGNIDQLSNYIKLFINDQELRNKFSINSRSIAIDHQGKAHAQGLLNAIQIALHTS
jgi:glycosyltransferase involved in cell wall biosynthesis